jgi:hypothetical protein
MPRPDTPQTISMAEAVERLLDAAGDDPQKLRVIVVLLVITLEARGK